MAKKKQGSGDDGAADTSREQPFQGVLLADSFVNSFRPLSLDRPKMLSPLNNVALIDYAIDFLAGAGVEELIVVCVSDQIEAHVTKDKSLPLKITVIKDSSLVNAGDALRELDKRAIVQSDPFLLMYGDVVTNVNVSAAIESHKVRNKKDRSAMMTMLMKPVGGSNVNDHQAFFSPIRSAAEDLVVGLDPTQENRVLLYDDKGPKSSVSVPCSFFGSHPQVDLRIDLLDCGIDICSPDVLARFTDEFDYSDIRRMFVANSVAEEEEGLQNKIYAHILGPGEYAARVHDFGTYDAISRDLLRRWCHPVVPDNLPSGYEKQYRYMLQRHYMYHERRSGTTSIARSSSVRGVGMVGANCRIGEDCQIVGTVIGNHCNIGTKVNLNGCHLWDNVEVQDGSVVERSILSDHCVIKSGAIVKNGCIIGAGCIVGAGVVLPEFTRLSLKKEEDDDFDDDWGDSEDESNEDETENTVDAAQELVSDVDTVGQDGKGTVWRLAKEEDDSDDENVPPDEFLRTQSVGFDRTKFLFDRQEQQREPHDDFSDDGSAGDVGDLDAYDGAVTFTSDAAAPAIVGRQKDIDVVKELKTICMEYEPTSPIENLAIELNSFKFSQNATYTDCTMAATLAILDHLKITKETSDGKLVQEFRGYLERWSPLLQKMSIGVPEEKGILEAISRVALDDSEQGQVLSSGKTFRFLLQTLHDEEVVGEEAVLAWADEQGSNGGGRLLELPLVRDFITWLGEDSEDDDSSDGSDSS